MYVTLNQVWYYRLCSKHNWKRKLIRKSDHNRTFLSIHCYAFLFETLSLFCSVFLKLFATTCTLPLVRFLVVCSTYTLYSTVKTEREKHVNWYLKYGKRSANSHTKWAKRNRSPRWEWETKKKLFEQNAESRARFRFAFFGPTFMLMVIFSD